MLSVLIVEDEPDDALLALRELKRGGFEPRSLRVESREELSAALDAEWDVVLCDYSLPLLDAYLALQMIVDRRPILPVIMVSGAIGEERAADLMHSGAADLVTKSKLSRLVPAVQRALSETATRQARVQAEQALQQSEERYRSLFTNLPVGVFRVDASGRLLSANPALRDMLGLTNAYEVLRSGVDEFVADPKQMMKIQRSFGKGASRLELELEMRRRNGETFWAMGHVTATRDTRDRVVFVDGIIQNIHKRKLLEGALSRGKEEWENTFDAVQELLLLVDKNGTIVRSNTPFADRIAHDVRSMPGRSSLDVLADADDEAAQKELLQMIRSGESHDVDVSSEALGGQFRFSVSPRTNLNGRIVGVIFVGRDVTIARKEEQLVRLREAIAQAERIFQTLRHEIGNVLNTLKTTLSVFKMKIDTFDSVQRATYFERCFATLGIAERLLRSLQSYQTFDRLNLVTMNLGEFLDQRLELVFENARVNEVACTTQMCSDNLVVNADADALVRIIVNLVENALSAVADTDGALVTVRCGSHLGSAVLEVSDNGCGIPEEELPLVFAPLHTTKAEGSGMGLAIVQKLMVNMGGVAEISSEVGRGTAVVLRLPLVEGIDASSAGGR